MSDGSRKRPLDDSVGDRLSLYNDPTELVNAVISHLACPEQKTIVAETYANDKNLATEVQAYAKIAGNNWTYYVKSLNVTIGRNTDTVDPHAEGAINIDLGPSKVVSRSHASINYNLNTRSWELYVSGRNGAKVDTSKVPCGPNSASTPLNSGAVVDIGGTQMMFILPDAQPVLSRAILDQVSPKLPQPKKKMAVDHSQALRGAPKGSLSGPMKAFQMFDNTGSPRESKNEATRESDLSMDESRDIKPPFSYATMITQAILSNTEGVLSLSEIYDWIAKHYAFYRFSKSGWQNSIRHNLSLNKAFEKVPRRPNEPGKGMKWQISDSYRDEFMRKFQSGSLSKARRGSSVSRQLQLHLINHEVLPASQSQRRKIPQHYAPNQQGQPLSYQQVQQQVQQSQPVGPQEALHFLVGSNGAQPFVAGQHQQQQQQQQQHPQQQQQQPYGNNMFIPMQLPPLQPGQPQHPQPQGAPMPYPHNIYAHSRDSSMGSNHSGAFPLQPPNLEQSRQPIQHQHQHQQAQLQSQPPPHQQVLPPSTLSSSQEQPGFNQAPQVREQQNHVQQKLQQKQEQQLSSSQDIQSPDTKPLSAVVPPSSRQDADTSSQTIRPVTTSTDRTELKPSTRDELDSQSQSSSPIKPDVKPFRAFTSGHAHSTSQQQQQQHEQQEQQQQQQQQQKQHKQQKQPQLQSQSIGSNGPDYGMIASPNKPFSIAAVEAYTPERGARKKDSADGGTQLNLQSSPALWNFVQFSTPLQPGQVKDSVSPTKNGYGNLPDSPLRTKTKQSQDTGELRNIDLAKGFKK